MPIQPPAWVDILILIQSSMSRYADTVTSMSRYAETATSMSTDTVISRVDILAQFFARPLVNATSLVIYICLGTPSKIWLVIGEQCLLGGSGATSVFGLLKDLITQKKVAVMLHS